jgi:hypothetical protein
MRLLALGIAVGLMVATPALSDSVPGGGPGSGGGTVIVDPGFCWGGGVIVGPPPGGGVRPPDDGAILTPSPGGYEGSGIRPGGLGISPAYAAGPQMLPTVAGQAEAPVGQSPGGGGGPASRPSQMYIPPAVWQWVAAHPTHR